MAISKTLGYILSLVAILGLILGFDPVATWLGIKLPITSSMLTLISVVILVVGIILIWKSGSSGPKQPSEVPIYHGKNIVGYRRMTKQK